jgi:hypothetical protein
MLMQMASTHKFSSQSDLNKNHCISCGCFLQLRGTHISEFTSLTVGNIGLSDLVKN